MSAAGPPQGANSASARYADVAVLIACIAGASWAAVTLRQDASWDLQNYHFYDAWAWLAGRIFDWDLAAAQLQTFHNPLADIPFYLLVAHGVDPRLITLWLALPTGIAAWLLSKIAWLLFADLRPAARIAATLAALAIGLTGATGGGQLGSTTGEWLVTAFTLGAVLVLLRERATDAAFATRTLVFAGLLAGLASGFKLTAATYALALCAAVLGARAPLRRNLRASVVYSFGVLGGLAVTLGPWAYQLWMHFRSPLFPYGNRWFHSPWWDFRSPLPDRFGAHVFSDWILLPWKLLGPPVGFVSELPYVDARLPLAWTLAVIGAGGAIVSWLGHSTAQRPPQFATTATQWRFVGIFLVASFIVWAIVHSILRYTIPLEITSGVVIVGTLGYLLRPRHAIVAIALALAGLAATTSKPDWGRVDFGPAWFAVRVPPIEPDALILLTVDAPMSYVLPFFPPDARHVGIRNNINDATRHNRLAETIAAIVRDHRGPVYSLSFPGAEGEADLRAHGLQRVTGGCASVTTNMPTTPIELCRLRRMGEMR
jgi:hypothetical protein